MMMSMSVTYIQATREKDNNNLFLPKLDALLVAVDNLFLPKSDALLVIVDDVNIHHLKVVVAV